ncbi:MAG: zinc ABC transporter substrate-binding protein, partial [Deltaproteobacteria bacterium]
MKTTCTMFLLAVVLGAPSLARATVRVFTCEPEWAALAAEIGGDAVEAFSATTGLQDPHRVEARPSLIARVRKADLLLCTGAELEIGWLPLLLRRAGNPKLHPGAPTYMLASEHVRILGKPKRLDRSLG